MSNVCTITNFDVEQYKPDEKFRTILNEYRLIFGEDTKVKLLEEQDSTFPEDTFDFNDHADLMNIANQNVYLTGKLSTNNMTVYNTLEIYQS